MSVHLPAHHQAARLPVGRALFVLPTAVVVTGGIWWWMTAGAPAADRTFVAWYGGVAAVVVCAAVTVAAYCVQAVRRLRGHAAALEADHVRLADDTLPAVVRRVRDGASVDTALAEVPGSVDGVHRRLLGTVAQEIGRGERMRAATMAACANAPAGFRRWPRACSPTCGRWRAVTAKRCSGTCSGWTTAPRRRAGWPTASP